MKKMHTLVLVGALGAAAIGGGILTSGVSAYRSNPAQVGPNYSVERHEAMQKAFDNKDYDAWNKLHEGRGRVNEIINRDNFDKFVEMRKLRLEGKVDESNKIREELGLGQGNEQGKGMRGGMRGQNREGNFVDKDGNGRCDNME